MTNSTVTIPAAVAHVNALITRAVTLGNVPEPRHGWNDRALMEVEVAKTLTFMPGFNLEFGEAFGSRVSLDVRPCHRGLGMPVDVRIGTSGNSRTVRETALLAKTLTGVAVLACDIESFLSSVNPEPLPEAVEAQAKEDAERRAASEKAQAEALAAEKAVRSERAKRAAQTRKEFAAFRK
jgi:hypothetical protein